MNKKISTLMAGGLLLTSVFASAKIDINNLDKAAKVENGDYIIVRDLPSNVPNTKAGELDDTDLVLQAQLDADGKVLTHSTKPLSAAKLDSAVWVLTVNEGTYMGNKTITYTLKNKTTGTYLTFEENGSITTDASKATKGEVSTERSAVFAGVGGETEAGTPFTNGGILYAKGTEGANALRLLMNGTVELGNTDGGINITLYKYTAEQKADIAKMNDTMGGNGFNLSSAANDYEGNIFKNLNLKAFEIPATGDDAIENVPAGTYLVLADNMPVELGLKDAKLNTRELFDACTFVAVDPTTNLNINEVPRDKGRGFWFTTVKGSDFYFFNTDAEGKSKADEIYVGNACFNIINPTLLDETTYQIYTTTARVLKAANGDEQIDANKQFIGSVKDQDVDYVITNTTGLTFTLTNGTLYDVTELLNDTNTPAIYTIQFVSGAEKLEKEQPSEYGQYLTLSKRDGQNTLSFASVVEYNPEDPMFQFVITAVDEDEKTVTFTNRQTKVSFETALYEDKANPGQYTIYPVKSNWDVYVETFDGDSKNDKVVLDPEKWNKMKILLTPVTVEDKFASFVNRAAGAGLVTFELAKNIDDVPEFYIGATYDEKTGVIEKDELLAYSDVANATQFELVKSEKPETILNSYIYMQNDRVTASRDKDTVAFYTYEIKAFDADIDNYYLGSKNRKFVLGTSGLDFVIKENVDGSVALIDYDATNKKLDVEMNTTVSNTNYLYVNETLEDGEGAWTTDNTYALEGKLSTGLKTFMVEENPAISYEAVPQHVSFQAALGGFLTMDENKDARLAIKEEASEDLTFWIDTVYSDRNIPSFYITKGGNFLYNTKDSADYYGNRGNDRFTVEISGTPTAKLIFKAGELISSDTLQTVIDGQKVLVAEKDNAPKNIKGGLSDFQFQIISTENGSDEYVIRQGAQYVCQVNNFFYLGKKDAAYSFIIEKQSAPTVNDEITASEVKVIAGNGQITIAGAAGKKVVVSNILGQVVANTVITSDNATIAAPQGIVVVAVEGEEAVKAIVK